jgi:hypothetical protein
VCVITRRGLHGEALAGGRDARRGVLPVGRSAVSLKGQDISGASEPEPAGLSPGQPSLLSAAGWGSISEDVSVGAVLRCGSGAQGRRLRLVPQPGPFPGES